MRPVYLLLFGFVFLVTQPRLSMADPNDSSGCRYAKNLGHYAMIVNYQKTKQNFDQCGGGAAVVLCRANIVCDKIPSHRGWQGRYLDSTCLGIIDEGMPKCPEDAASCANMQKVSEDFGGHMKWNKRPTAQAEQHLHILPEGTWNTAGNNKIHAFPMVMEVATCGHVIRVCHGEVVKSDRHIEHPFCMGNLDGCPKPDACMEMFHRSQLKPSLISSLDMVPIPDGAAIETPPDYGIFHSFFDY
jgi:hypothetical protein